MNDQLNIKEAVRSKYAAIATGEVESCCATSCCGGPSDISMIGDEYSGVAGHVADADLGLGCGIPTEHARIEEGQTVLDLGSGAGIDAFVARSIVGETGRVIGVDMTFEMVEKARRNADSLGYDNVSFKLGEIEDLPLSDASVDVVVSNCVLNLVPDKPRAFAEMYRVIRPGGHFCVSDVVVRGELPESVRASAELYAGCVAGAIEEESYLDGIREAGFKDVRVVREKEIDIPVSALPAGVSAAELEAFRQAGHALMSITVFGEKR
jgi:arsenite methyltransferase